MDSPDLLRRTLNMTNEVFLKSASACVTNGNRILDDAEMLEYSEPPATAFALAIIAQEEFAKGFLLTLVARQVIPWHPLIYRASRDHACKQLLGIVMEYLNPDFDDFLRRHEEWQKQHEEVMQLLASLRNESIPHPEVWQRINELRPSTEGLPAPVADAISILRYEKIERWRSSRWVWSEDPTYDPVAKKTGEGTVDREKQDALYVRLRRSGEVAGSPTTTVAQEMAKEAMERARRFRNLVDSMIGDATVSEQHAELEQAIKLVFQDLEEALSKRSSEE
jgi:AbiV family abortive infection protein